MKKALIVDSFAGILLQFYYMKSPCHEIKNFQSEMEVL